MAVLTIEVPDNLLQELAQSERSAQEIVTSIVESELKKNSNSRTATQVEPSKEEIVQRLVAAGLMREPAAWDSPGARAWREMPEEEKDQHLRETQAMYFPDAPASRAVIRGRKRLDTDVPRAEVERRLRKMGLIRPKRVWNTISTRGWEALSEDEKQRFIAEMNQLYFPDSPASTYITESRK